MNRTFHRAAGGTWESLSRISLGAGIITAGLLLSVSSGRGEELLSGRSSRLNEKQSTDTLSGVVRWSGEIPSSEPFEVNTDEIFCAPRGELPNERVEVDPVTRAVRNAVVWLEPVDSVDLPTTAVASVYSRPPALLELKECRFKPVVGVVPLRERARVISRDDVLHRVTVDPPYGISRSFDLGFNGSSETFRLTTPGIYRFHCERHPWEDAVLVAAKHAFYALTDESGSFRFSGVPRGDYRLRAWHNGMRMSKTVRAGLVTGYTFSAGAEAVTRVRVPDETERPALLTLKEDASAEEKGRR